MSKVRMLLEVPYTTKRHRAFKLLSKDITISNKWLRMCYRDLSACLEVCGRLLAVRATLTYPNVYDNSVIDPSCDDINVFIEEIRLMLNRKNNDFIGCSYVREFGEGKGKKHYHVVLYFNGYLHKGIGNVNNKKYKGIHGVLEKSWQYVSENPHVHIDNITMIDREHVDKDKEVINKELFYYLCKMECKLSDGFKNYGGRVVEGKKKEDAETSSLNNSQCNTKNNNSKISTGVLSHTPYNDIAVENDNGNSVVCKSRYDMFLRYFTRYWDSYSKLLIVGIKYHLPTEMSNKSHESSFRNYLKNYSQKVKKTLQEEHIGYGGLFGTLLKEGNQYYCYTVLFLSGHDNKQVMYRKDNFPSLFTLFQSCWKKVIGYPSGECCYLKHVNDKSLFESKRKKNGAFSTIARYFLFPFIFNDTRSRIYSHQ